MSAENLSALVEGQMKYTEADLQRMVNRGHPRIRMVSPISKRVKIQKANEGEQLFAFQAKSMKLPRYEAQFLFAPPRKYRSDFAWPDFKLLFECQGGVHTQGRHVRGSGFTDECERRSIAAIFGFSIIEATTEQVYSGDAVEWVRQCLVARGWNGAL